MAFARDWDFDKYFAQWAAIARAVVERVPEARLGGRARRRL
jgi:hypothetical protein